MYKKLFSSNKPIIGLLHLKALPGDPFYDKNISMKKIIEHAKKNLESLQAGGVDGVLITNEFSMPYEKTVSKVTIASMARVFGAIEDSFDVPFGIEAIYDGDATIELCAATDADFTRCVFTGAWAGDFGIVDKNVSKTLRLKKSLSLDNLKMFYFVNSEGEVFLNDRSFADMTKTMIFNCRPDYIVVAGGMAGSRPENILLKEVKNAAKNTPVFNGTGCNIENVEQILSISDGAFVGTFFKKNGLFQEEVDKSRVSAFMKKVKSIREREDFSE